MSWHAVLDRWASALLGRGHREALAGRQKVRLDRDSLDQRHDHPILVDALRDSPVRHDARLPFAVRPPGLGREIPLFRQSAQSHQFWKLRLSLS